MFFYLISSFYKREKQLKLIYKKICSLLNKSQLNCKKKNVALCKMAIMKEVVIQVAAKKWL